MSEFSKNDIERLVNENPRVGLKRLSDSAVIPTKAHPNDSGFDLYAAEDVIVEPGETAVIPTALAAVLPEGYEAQVRPRSGITEKTKLRVQLGTIDNGYRGEIGVIADNIKARGKIVDNNGGFTGLSNHDVTYAYTLNGNDSEVGFNIGYGSYLIRKGDRIAQLVIQPLPTVDVYEVEGELKETDRGADGFGSSGISVKKADLREGLINEIITDNHEALQKLSGVD